VPLAPIRLEVRTDPELSDSAPVPTNMVTSVSDLRFVLGSQLDDGSYRLTTTLCVISVDREYSGKNFSGLGFCKRCGS